MGALTHTQSSKILIVGGRENIAFMWVYWEEATFVVSELENKANLCS